jgi:chromate transport protein ChrA
MREHIYKTAKAFANWSVGISMTVAIVIGLVSCFIDIKNSLIIMDVIIYAIALAIVGLMFEVVRMFMNDRFKFEEDEEL